MNHPPASSRFVRLLAVVATAASGIVVPAARAVQPAEIARDYTVQAGTPADPARGRRFFGATHGRDWSCATCHGATPTQPGRHATTGRPIGAMAPVFNPDRLTNPAKVEKWFRRNCHDVLGRECTAAEKADVLGWLIDLKR